MKNLPSNVFRANVGAIIINDYKKVLALERKNIKGAWQMPQGGLNEDEEPLDAIKREILEETSITKDDLILLNEYPEWLAYELPKEKRTGKYGRGQVQKWFLFRFIGLEAHIDIENVEDQEFSSWKWIDLSEIVENTIEFRKGIYNKLLVWFQSIVYKNQS